MLNRNHRFFISKHFFTIGLLTLFAFAANAQTTVVFSCTGGAQSWVIPPCVTSISVSVAGSQGGGASGGLGAVVTAVIPVTSGQTLQVNVGCTGGCPSTGFNGGGSGQNASAFGYSSWWCSTCGCRWWWWNGRGNNRCYRRCWWMC